MQKKGGVTVIIGDNANVETEYGEADGGGRACGGCGYGADEWMEYCPACGDRLADEDEGAATVMCPRCGAGCPEDARFCPMCGAELPDEDEGGGEDDGPEMVVVCPTCGEGNPEGANFCHVCGTALAGVAAVPDEEEGGGSSLYEATGGEPYEMAAGSARYEMDGIGGDWTCSKCAAVNKATDARCKGCGWRKPFGAKALFGAAIVSALSEVAQRGSRPDVRRGDYVSWYVGGARGQGIVDRVHRRGVRATVAGEREATLLDPVLRVKAHGLNEDASWHDLRRVAYVRAADTRFVDQMWLSNRAKV